VAEAVARLKLSHVVITSPTRDDLPDGGVAIYAATVAAIRSSSPATRIGTQQGRSYLFIY